MASRSELADALLDASPDGVVLVDASGVIIVANPAAAEIFGRSTDDLVGRSVDRLVPDEFRSRHYQHREQFQTASDPRPMGTGLELFGQRKDGSLVPVEISLSPVEIDGARYTIAAVRDVTERQESRSQLTLLRDRERIARDLHDMVIQRLFAAGMGLQAVAGMSTDTVVKARISETIDDLDATIAELRAAIFALSRGDVGTSPRDTLIALIESRRASLGFDPVVTIDGDLDAIDSTTLEHLEAALTESLSNVARHANASSAAVSLGVVDGEVVLEVVDDGDGIPNAPTRGGGLGNLMWRAAQLGGVCHVERVAPSGTKVAWSVPAGTT